MYLTKVYCICRSYIQKPFCEIITAQCNFPKKRVSDLAGNYETATRTDWSFARGSTLLGSVPWQQIWGCTSVSVSRNGVYKMYDLMHVAFPRIIPRIMPPNHTRESYHESYPWFQQGRAKHTPKHTPETYLRNIPRIIPPDATRFAGQWFFFGKD